MPDLKVVKLATKYPQGDEKRLIDATLNRVVPSGGLPMDAGVIVSNVSTVNAVYEAIYYDKPLYERVMTVTGHNVKTPQNVIVKVGTASTKCRKSCRKSYKLYFGTN